MAQKVRTGEKVALGFFTFGAAVITISTYFHDGHVTWVEMGMWLLVVGIAADMWYRPVRDYFRK